MSRNWNSMREMLALQERLNRLFEESGQNYPYQRRGGEESEENTFERVDWQPAADVYEREQGFIIALDLPGIMRETLEINLDENRLTVRGERSAEVDEGQGRAERPFGRFSRRFGLPQSIDQAAIKAEYKDGVLRVYLPKREEQKARRIAIKVQ